jgi:hypothetical protein
MNNSGFQLQWTPALQTQVVVAIRYEYAISVIRKSDIGIRPCFGFAVSPYVHHLVTIPALSVVFPTYYNGVGSQLSVVPRMRYHVSETFYLDVNVPLPIVDIHWVCERVDDPSAPQVSSKFTSFSYDALPAGLSVRVGMGMRL